MTYIIAIIGGYLLGCSSMSYYIEKITKVNIKERGSKNYGASNTVALVGWKAGILVALHDIAKAFLAVWLMRTLFPNAVYIGAVAGIASVLGHIFPFYLKFDGGKGFASYMGMTLALNWKFALLLIVLAVIVTVVTDYIVVGTMLTIFSVPAYLGFESKSWILAMILILGSVVILYKHRENFTRIINGTEMRFSGARKNKYKE